MIKFIILIGHFCLLIILSQFCHESILAYTQHCILCKSLISLDVDFRSAYFIIKDSQVITPECCDLNISFLNCKSIAITSQQRLKPQWPQICTKKNNLKNTFCSLAIHQQQNSLFLSFLLASTNSGIRIQPLGQCQLSLKLQQGSDF